MTDRAYMHTNLNEYCPFIPLHLLVAATALHHIQTLRQEQQQEQACCSGSPYLQASTLHMLLQ